MKFRIFLSLIILFISPLVLAGKMKPIEPIEPVKFTVTVNNSCSAKGVIDKFTVKVGQQNITYTSNDFNKHKPCRDLSTITTISSVQLLSFKVMLTDGTILKSGDSPCAKHNKYTINNPISDILLKVTKQFVILTVSHVDPVDFIVCYMVPANR